MNYGFQNEIDFVKLFNNKYIYELDKNSTTFLKALFKDILDETEKIKAWKNKINQKTDIFIKYKNYIKNISLKCGNSNSIHHEPIQEFKVFLGKILVPYKIIEYYTSYQYGYLREDGIVNINKALNSNEYKELYQHEIDIFNKEINKTKVIIEMVDRFIIRGRNSDYDIDALICGTINNYVWILKDDIYDLILNKRNVEFSSPHIGCLTIGPKKRNISGASKYFKERYIVCVRWNNIWNDIIEFKKYKI